MKICMLTTTHNALDSRVFCKEAITLKSKYEDVTIIAPDINNYYMVEGIKIIGITRADNLMQRYKLIDELLLKAKQVNADIYHFHDYEILLKIKKLKKSNPKCKLIYDVHEDFPDMMCMSNNIPHCAAFIMSKFVAATEKLIASSMDYVITADGAVEKRFLKINKNTKAIYNFPSIKMVMLSQQDKKDFDIIYEGALTLERGIFELVKSIKIIKDTYKPDVKLLLLYSSMDSYVQNVVKQYIKDNNLIENIVFIDRVPHDEVFSYICRSKIGAVLLKPYKKYFKNIPIKQFEYMSCGIPVVGSDLPPISMFVNKYNSGIVVNPEDISEIAKSFIRLLKDDRMRTEMGLNGIYAIRQDFNWENMSDSLLKIYNTFQ
ncbi:glycosyltransferase [Clostridium oryzae]|uniref:D-inositol-3-phosphate glycosyltransferase n=1 Tax=Clostridium oryzae TaxID=1450648 RepID=A0A1V4IYB7_9CLOT|nr:glycosyltransferase [Clostridium oryzae]OPJ65041.1 D-inositol-3-phosphate glycosyltransferase [Clostridium oryzae]